MTEEQRWNGQTWEERRRDAVERIYPTGAQKPPPIDYNERGIWRCFRCKDMGEVLVGRDYYTLPTSERWVTCPDCNGQSLHDRRTERLLKHSGLEAYLQTRTLANFEINAETEEARQLQAKAKYEANRYAESPQGWIIFYGGTGGGKTHLAAAITNWQLAVGTEVVFQTVPDLMMEIQSTYDRRQDHPKTDQIIDAIRSVALLVLDDLGTHHDSPDATVRLFQIINHRENAGLPMVVTTNLEPGHLHPRIQSRFMNRELSRMLELHGVDQRARAGSLGKSAE